MFNLKYSHIQKTLDFLFYYLIDNKLNVFRWKLLHHILPCKVLLHQWKLACDDKCKVCNVTENYEHFFIKCNFLTEFWNKIKILLNNLKIGIHIITLKTIVIGYKIHDNAYNDINYFITIIFYTVFKSVYMSDYKQKHINVYALFRKEFFKQYDIFSLTHRKPSRFLDNVAFFI